jgi:nucleoside-diphosphate-sugar epimerase
MRKALLIGGLGYIGHYLKEELIRASYQPYFFDIQKWKENVSNNSKFLVGNRNNPDDLVRARNHHFDCVVDLIAYRSQQTRMIVEIFKGYTDWFIHLSTFSVYDVPSISPFSEQCPIVSTNDDSYSGQKAACERELMEAGEKDNFPFVIIRSAPIMGPGDNVSRENYFIKRILTHSPILLPDSGQTPVLAVFIKDLARVVVQAIGNRQARGKAFHVAQREIVSLRRHVEKITRLVKGINSVKGISPPELVFATSEELVRAGFNLAAFPYYSTGLFLPDITAASEVLGFIPTPYEEAVEITIKWFTANNALSLPAWPGKVAMQARLAATNDTLHYLKEQEFIKRYLFLKHRFLIDLHLQMKTNFDPRDILELSIALFTGCIPPNKKGITKVLVHTDVFHRFCESNLARSLDTATTLCCLLPDDLIENLCPVGPKPGINKTVNREPVEESKKDCKFQILSFLEPVHRGNQPHPYRRYLLYSNNLDSLDNRGWHYSHDYKCRLLTILYDNRIEQEREQNEFSIPTDGSKGVARLLEKVEDWQKKGEVEIDLSRDLYQCDFARCRVARGPCEARRFKSLIIDRKGNLRICLLSPGVGHLDDSMENISARINDLITSIKTKRGCKSCYIYSVCPCCLFVKDHEEYCRILRNNPDIYRYCELFDFLIRLVEFEPSLSKVTTLKIKVSTMAHRLFLPYLESFAQENRAASPVLGYSGPLLVVVGNENYIYRINDRIVIKADPLSCLILEVWEERFCKPVELAGKMFYFDTPRRLKAEEIREAIEQLVRWRLIKSSRDISSYMEV